MTRQEMTQIVRKAIQMILPSVPVREIHGGKHLRDLGADSVDRIEIITAICHQLGLDEPLSHFAKLRNIDELVDFLYERQAI